LKVFFDTWMIGFHPQPAPPQAPASRVRRATAATDFANHLHQTCWHAREQICQSQFGADFLRLKEISFCVWP